MAQIFTNNNPLVSIIIPLFNGGKYIESTLMSVLGQTYYNYEIIVINDGSKDDGQVKVSELIEKYPERIQLITHSDYENHGIAVSRNLGIRHAKGTYIAFLDQDDLWLPEKLNKQIEALLLYPDAALVYAKSSFIDQRGNEEYHKGVYPTYGKGVSGIPQNVFSKLIMEDIIPTLTVVVRKCCLERVGLFDEGPRYEYEDWLLYSKLAYFYKFIFIPEVLSKYRWHHNNYSWHLFNTGLIFHAEEHCTITLFTFLKKESSIEDKEFRKYLHKRIWRFFLRARSWGDSIENLKKHRLNFINAFPLERRTIKTVYYTVVLLNPIIASVLRKIRRIIVRM